MMRRIGLPLSLSYRTTAPLTLRHAPSRRELGPDGRDGRSGHRDVPAADEVWHGVADLGDAAP